MFRNLIRGSILVLIFTAFLWSQSFVEEAASALQAEAVAKIIYFKGEVEVRKATTGEWVDAEVGMLLSEGDKLVTKEAALVEIGFGKEFKNAIRVEADSELTISTVSPTEIEMLKGRIFSLVEKLEGKETFTIRTPTAVASARGTGWESRVGGRATFCAFEGMMFVQGIRRDGTLMPEVVVPAGWKTFVERFERPSRLEKVTRLERGVWRSNKRDLRDHVRKLERIERRPPTEKRLPRIEERIEKIEERIEGIEEKIEEKIEKEQETYEAGDEEKIKDRITPPPTTTIDQNGGY